MLILATILAACSNPEINEININPDDEIIQEEQQDMIEFDYDIR